MVVLNDKTDSYWASVRVNSFQRDMQIAMHIQHYRLSKYTV